MKSLTTYLKPRADRWDGLARIIVCACVGSARLGGALGVPVVHVGVARDAEAALRRLNADGHGGWARGRSPSHAPRSETGWTDWGLVPLEARPLEAAPGVRFRDGVIVVQLPDGTTVEEFACSLAGALRHLRIQEAVLHPGDRGAFGRGPLAHARYSPSRRRADGGEAGCELVTDLFAIDPVENAWRLYWLVASAHLSVCARTRPVWR